MPCPGGLSSYDCFLCFEGPKHKIWVIHTFETPASLRVLAQTFNWGSDRNILSGSELRKRNLAIEVFRSQWPTQCAHMSDIPDFNRFCRQDRKILRALLDFFFWTVKYFESAANLKMQNEKYTFIFILNIENMESALPVKRKIKKLWPYRSSKFYTRARPTLRTAPYWKFIDFFQSNSWSALPFTIGPFQLSKSIYHVKKRAFPQYLTIYN